MIKLRYSGAQEINVHNVKLESVCFGVKIFAIRFIFISYYCSFLFSNECTDFARITLAFKSRRLVY